MKQNWEYKKLSDIASFINGDRGKNYPSQNDFISEGIPFVNAGHIFNNKVIFDSMNYISEEKYNKLGSGKIQIGDILFCLRGSLGKKAIVNNIEKGAIASSLVIIRSKEVNNSFLSYFLESPLVQSSIISSNSGSSQPNLSAKTVSHFLVPVPSAEEQRKVSSELDIIKSIIEKKKSQLFELNYLAQSIFFEMFGDPFINERGWETKTIGSVCFEKRYIDRANKYYNPSDEINYIDISSIDNKSNIISTTNKFVFCEAPSRAQQIVKKGDILVSTVRPNLKNIAVVNVDLEDIVASSGFCVLRPKNIELSFLLNILLSHSFTESLLTKVTGANYPAVREDDIKKSIIGIPPLSLQQAFAEKIEAIEAMKTKIRQSLDESETLFNSRMDYYFN